jgi:putative transposase
MPYDPQRHHRRSIRLKGYDYSRAGVYFVTICVQGGLCLLGEVIEGEMRPDAAGEMVERVWLDLPGRFPNIDLDAYRVMPNHFHGLVVILDDDPTVKPKPTDKERTVGAGVVPTQKATLGAIVGAFKSITTNEYIDGVKELGWRPFERRLWLRNYYEHIVRNEDSLNKIREYIINNPATWTADQLHPDAPASRFNRIWGLQEDRT